MIAFQFRAGTVQYFLNKYIILSQRVQSARTERTAGRILLFKANGQEGPTDWVDAMGPLIKYNSVTGRNHHDVKIGNIYKSIKMHYEPGTEGLSSVTVKGGSNFRV